MRTRFIAASSFLLLALPLHLAHTQVATASAASVRPADLAGLYRMETPSSNATSTVRYLRLFSDGRSRLESVRIDGTASPISARVEVGPIHQHPWRVKMLSPGAAPQLCFQMNATESCTAFHKEMPGGDLFLFAPDANWGSPTLILRREGSDRTSPSR